MLKVHATHIVGAEVCGHCGSSSLDAPIFGGLLTSVHWTKEMVDFG